MCFGKGQKKQCTNCNLHAWVADGLRRLLVERVPLAEAPLTDLLKLDALSPFRVGA